VASQWVVSLRCISAFAHPSRALSLCVAGCGYGAEPEYARAVFALKPTP